ncbi:MAG: tetratricopeptide repeat protein [Phycisphaerae bacterium]|nr:tetratricopeptide repeat protein [Phycisphaerae bacterium]
MIQAHSLSSFRLPWCALAAATALLVGGAGPSEPSPDAAELATRAEAARRAGKAKEAAGLIDRAVAIEPENHRWWNQRGSLHFRQGRIADSIRDFDQAIKLRPAIEPYHWQRGISYYYAGAYDKGRRQFEIHQTVNPNDVENAAWHYLCVARSQGVEIARAALLPIRGDGRIPMMKVYALLQGRIQPPEVLAAAEQAPVERRRLALFYAHLYLGLYYEAAGQDKPAARHMQLAAVRYIGPHYMGDVARVHHLRLEAKAKAKAKQPQGDKAE